MARATIRVLSIVISALSAASFVQALLNIGLISTLEGIATYYRELAASVFGLPTALLGVRPPQVVVDMWALSFIGAGAYVRTPGIEQSRALCEFMLNAQSLWWKIGLFFVLGFSGLGIGVVLGAIHPLTYVDGFHGEPQDLMKGAAKNVLLVCVGAIVFFALNAFAPSR